MRAHSNNKNSNDNDNDNNKTSYDKTTGLVFAETVARRRRGTKALIDRCRGRVPTEPGEPRWREAAAAAAAVSSSFSSSSSSARVDTLQDMALRVILRNLDRFDVDSLAWMPEIVLLRIWKKIKASSLDSIRLWQVFTLALASSSKSCTNSEPEDAGTGSKLTSASTFAPLSDHVCRVPRPEARILTSHSLATLDSDRYAWLTVVCLNGNEVGRELGYDGWMNSLKKIKSLTVLSIASGQDSGNEGALAAKHDVDDEMIRRWSRQAAAGGGSSSAATSDGAFQNLRAIFLRGLPGVTEKCLEHLESFPRLQLFCTSRCGANRHGSERGGSHASNRQLPVSWRRSEGEDGLYAYINDSHRAFNKSRSDLSRTIGGGLYAWWFVWQDLVEGYIFEKRSEFMDGSASKKPLLLVRLGSAGGDGVRRQDEYTKELDCYVRIKDGSSSAKEKEKGKTPSNEDGHSGHAAGQPKRRKLRHGKKQGLEDMLLTF